MVPSRSSRTITTFHIPPITSRATSIGHHAGSHVFSCILLLLISCSWWSYFPFSEYIPRKCILASGERAADDGRAPIAARSEAIDSILIRSTEGAARVDDLCGLSLWLRTYQSASRRRRG